MTKGIKILIAIVAVAVIAGATILLMPKNQSDPQKASSNESSSSESEGANSTAPSEADVTITYNGTSFSLSATTVKSGGTVKVMNTSSKDLEFESDPHPAHTNNSELNAGAIQPGKSVIFTLEKKGKWGFHNHLSSSQRGELTVE